jgi:hypothetical protein
VLLLIPVEFLRWVIIILAGGASSWFIASNLECTEGADMTVLIAECCSYTVCPGIVHFFLPEVLADFPKVYLSSVYIPALSFNKVLLLGEARVSDTAASVLNRRADRLFLHIMVWQASFEGQMD